MQGKRNDSLIKQRENTYTPKPASCVTIKERECIRLENYTLSWRNTLRLLTLTEYCLLIFFTGFYLAVTGFTAKDIGLYIGIALIYIFSHIFSKRLLEKRGKENKQVHLFFSVLAIIGSVFVTVLCIALVASFSK